MVYREFAPRRELAEWVVCTWERAVPATGAPPTSRVLPDGCTDIVWRDGQLLIAGPDTAPITTPLAPGETIVGLRLRPGVAGPVLGIPAKELRDARVPLDELWGRLAAEAGEQLADAAEADGRHRALEEIALARLAGPDEPDALVLTAAQWLGRPGAGVATLSDALSISERQLLRRFEAAVGYGPKTLDRILRFQRFLSRAPAVAAGDETLARLAAELGYADQAHLGRECVRLSGLTPRQLVASWSAATPPPA